jgi:uncharacterized protein
VATDLGRPLDLELVGGEPLAVCRLEGDAPIPAWAEAAEVPLLALTRTTGELSIVCAEAEVPASARASRGWRAIRVVGTLEHSEAGVLASLAAPLARA